MMEVRWRERNDLMRLQIDYSDVIWKDVSLELTDDTSDKPLASYVHFFEEKYMENKYLKLITLGYTETGKTYYLGSLYKLSFETGSKGFSLQNKAFHQTGMFQDIWGTITAEKGGAIPTTMGLRHAEMILKKGVDNVLNVLITDVEGQAIEPGRSVETAEQIINVIGQYDGLLLFLKAPKDRTECQKCKQQLASMMNFASILLSKNGRKIPVVLLLNQIDTLPIADGIRTNVDNEVNELRSKFQKEYGTNRKAINKAIKAQMGELMSRQVRKAIDTDEIDDLIEQFYKWIQTSKTPIPNRIFPCTSLGFDNTKQNPEDTKTLIAKFETLEPYGTIASFLWVMYGRLQLGLDGDFLTMLKNTWRGTKESLASELIEDIRDLHNRGEAYFDNDNAIWNLRSLSELYSKGF